MEAQAQASVESLLSAWYETFAPVPSSDLQPKSSQSPAAPEDLPSAKIMSNFTLPSTEWTHCTRHHTTSAPVANTHRDRWDLEGFTQSSLNFASTLAFPCAVSVFQVLFSQPLRTCPVPQATARVFFAVMIPSDPQQGQELIRIRFETQSLAYFVRRVTPSADAPRGWQSVFPTTDGSLKEDTTNRWRKTNPFKILTELLRCKSMLHQAESPYGKLYQEVFTQS